MGLLSKIWKGFKKIVKKIGKGIKKAFKKVGKFFGKMGILGHIGMMFIMPYAGAFWGNLGKFATKLAQGTNIAGKAFGHVMRGIYHAGKAAGTVYSGVTEAISGSMKWISNKVGLTDFADPFKGLKQLGEDTDMWLKDGWKGTIEGQSFAVTPDGGKLYHEEMSTEMQEAFKTADFKPKSLMESDSWKNEYPESTVDATGKEVIEENSEKTEEVTTEETPPPPETPTFKDKLIKTGKEKTEKAFDNLVTQGPLAAIKGAAQGAPEITYDYASPPQDVWSANDGTALTDMFGGGTLTVEGMQSNGYNYGGPYMDAHQSKVFSGFENYHQYLNQRYAPSWAK